MNLMVQALRRRQRDHQANTDTVGAGMYSTGRLLGQRASGAVSSIVLWVGGLGLAFLIVAGLVMYYLPQFMSAPPPILPPGFQSPGGVGSPGGTPLASVATAPGASPAPATAAPNAPTSAASTPTPSAPGAASKASAEAAGPVPASAPVVTQDRSASAPVVPSATAQMTISKEASKSPLPEVSTRFVARPVAEPSDRLAMAKEPKKASASKESSGPRLTKVPTHGGVDAAWKALAAGRLDEAELLYARVLSEQPSHVDALVGLAHVLHRQGHREAALQTYRLALSHAPDNATALSASLALMSEADPATAESRLKDYLESRPQDDAAHVSLGQTLGRQGRWSEAQAAFFKAYTLHPQSAANAYNLAVSLDHLHQYGQALKFYRAAVAASRQGDIPMESALRRIDVLAKELSNEP